MIKSPTEQKERLQHQMIGIGGDLDISFISFRCISTYSQFVFEETGPGSYIRKPSPLLPVSHFFLLPHLSFRSLSSSLLICFFFFFVPSFSSVLGRTRSI